MSYKKVIYVEDDKNDVDRLKNKIFSPERSLCSITHIKPFSTADNQSDLEKNLKLIEEEQKKGDIDFIIFDLAFSDKEHQYLEQWIDLKEFPKKCPSDFSGGLALVNQLVKDNHPLRKKCVILSGHQQKDNIYRNIAMAGGIWWPDFVPKAFNKKEGLETLKKHVENQCNVDSQRFFCVTNNSNFGEKVKKSIDVLDKELAKCKIEPVVDEVHFDDFNGDNLSNLITKHNESIKKHGFFDFSIIDITLSAQGNDLVRQVTISEETNEDIKYAPLNELPAIKLIEHIRNKNKESKIIAAIENKEGYTPGLIRWLMHDKKVNFVICMSDFELTVFGALWHFISQK